MAVVVGVVVAAARQHGVDRHCAVVVDGQGDVSGQQRPICIGIAAQIGACFPDTSMEARGAVHRLRANALVKLKMTVDGGGGGLVPPCGGWSGTPVRVALDVCNSLRFCSSCTYELIESVAQFLLDRVSIRPKIGIICGSGMGKHPIAEIFKGAAVRQD